MAEVIKIGKLSDSRLKEISEQGIEVKESVNVEDLNLPEPSFGETFCFHAEPEEASIFLEMKESAQQVERTLRDLMGMSISELGKSIRSTDPNRPLYEQLQEDKLRPKFESEEQEEELYRLAQKKNFLHALLYWKIGERGNLHSHRLGIRKPSHGDDRLRIVKIQKRIESEFENE